MRTLVRHDKDRDAQLYKHYELDETTLTRIREAYDVGFDIMSLGRIRIILRRPHLIDQAPYLIHTNYELLLLLDGRKKLARMGEAFPPFRFEGEDRFDHWVEQGVLHREEAIETFDEPIKHWLGVRTVFYTLIGEEWRIPAMKLILNASRKSGGWNEYFERMEGMLFGYEDWQNDWWLNEYRLRRGKIKS